MKREPNTEYVLSLSYGKDSLACLEAIRQLGYPLDRIVHAEVWATDTIPADLPPMVDFKAHADKIIKDKYGIEVEHICAVRGVRNLPTTPNSTSGLTKDETKTESMVSLTPSEHGAIADSKLMPCSQSVEKITYEKLFYHVPKRRTKPDEREREREREIQDDKSKRIPSAESALVQFRTQKGSHQTTQFSDFPLSEDSGATAISNSTVYGFPISIGRGNWCTQLKQRVFQMRH